LRLRKRLEPYFYTLAWLAHTQGQLLIRPLFWPDGIDPALWEVDDAFLLGDALLVAPVLEPQAERRDVILPAGRWYNVWDDRVIEGPGKATLETALDRIPLLARGGSVIPMLEGGILTLHLYAPSQEAGGGMLYSDEGDGYGPWRLDRFGFSQLEDGWELVWDQQGEFLFPFERITIEFHGFDANRAIVDEQELEIVERRLEVGYFESLRFFGD
jgi:alpha-glucosidase